MDEPKRKVVPPVPTVVQAAEKADRSVCPKSVDEEVKPAGLFTASVRDRLVRLAFRFLWNPNDAEDVAQEALAIAYERKSDLRDRDQWWTWVCRILVNRCHEHGRRTQRRKRHDDAIRADLNTPGTGGSLMGRTETTKVVRHLMQGLPRRQREVTVLRHLQDMSFEEIGSVLGISPATARVHARAAREALRRLLHERHPTWFDDMTRPGTKEP